MDDEQRQRFIAYQNVVRVLNGLLPAPPAPPQVHHVPGPAYPVNFQQFMMNQLYQEQLPQRIGQVFPQNPPIQNADFLIPALQGFNRVAAAMQAPQPLFPAAQLPNLFNPGQAPVNVGAHFLNLLFPPPPPPPSPRQEFPVLRGLIERVEPVRQANPAHENNRQIGRKRERNPAGQDVNGLVAQRTRAEPPPQYPNIDPLNLYDLNLAPQFPNPAPQDMNPAPQDMNPAPQNMDPVYPNLNFDALKLILPILMPGPYILAPQILNPAPQNLDPTPQSPAQLLPSAEERIRDFKVLILKHEYFKRNSPEAAFDNISQIGHFLSDEEQMSKLPVLCYPMELKQLKDPNNMRERSARVVKEPRADGLDSDSDDDEMGDNLCFRYNTLDVDKGFYAVFAFKEVESRFPTGDPTTLIDDLLDLLPIQSTIDVPIQRRRLLNIAYIHVTQSYRKIRMNIRNINRRGIPILEYCSTDKGCLFRCDDTVRFVKGTTYQTLAANHFTWILRNHRADYPITTIRFDSQSVCRFDPPIWPFRSFFRKIGKALEKNQVKPWVRYLNLEAPKYEGNPEEGAEILELILPRFRVSVEVELTVWDDRKLLETRNIRIADPCILLGEHFKPNEGSGWLEAEKLSFEKRSFRLTEEPEANFDFLFHPDRKEISIRLGNWEFERIIDVYDRKGGDMNTRSCLLEDVLGVDMEPNQETEEKKAIVQRKTDENGYVAGGKVEVRFSVDEHNKASLKFVLRPQPRSDSFFNFGNLL